MGSGCKQYGLSLFVKSLSHTFSGNWNRTSVSWPWIYWPIHFMCPEKPLCSLFDQVTCVKQHCTSEFGIQIQYRVWKSRLMFSFLRRDINQVCILPSSIHPKLTSLHVATQPAMKHTISAAMVHGQTKRKKFVPEFVIIISRLYLKSNLEVKTYNP